MFNTRYINHLENEIKQKDKRIEDLELRIFELLDTKFFNRTPERLVRKEEPKTEKPADNFVTTQPSDALSAAEEDAWNRSKPKDL